METTPENQHDLASEKQDQPEPVAWFSPTSKTFSTVETSHHIAPLYLHPAPQRSFVRLSEEEVNSLTYAPYEPYELICAVENMLERKNNG